MRRYFEFNRTENDAFNALVEGALDLARQKYEGNVVADYKEKNAELIKSMGKKMVEGTRYEADFDAKGLSIFKDPQVKANTAIRDNFNAVIAQVVTAIVPEVVNDTFENYIAEVHQVGFGDTARFIIESNELFKVNEKAEGVRKGVDQPMYDDEITVHARPVEISTHIDWYPFAAGVFDMGNFALKIGRSFAAYIFLKAIKGMTAATSGFGAAYGTNGVTPALWGTLRERVSAANGGMNVIAIGTAVALSNVSLQGNFQVEIGEEMNKVGYLSQYLGVPLIALKNVLIPGTTNTTADLALDDHKIFFVPVAGDKPVKILFEGNEVTVTYNPEESSDKRYGITVELRVGVSAICGAKYGTITI